MLRWDAASGQLDGAVLLFAVVVLEAVWSPQPAAAVAPPMAFLPFGRERRRWARRGFSPLRLSSNRSGDAVGVRLGRSKERCADGVVGAAESSY